MIRIGMVDFDTSHVVEFSKRINHAGVDPDQWVDGGKVVLGYRGSSEITPDEKIDQYEKDCREICGVEMVDRLEDLLGRVDAVCIESQQGAVHLERVRPFLEAGLPVFIDKPFASTMREAASIAALARKHGAPLFSASSLRYAPEVQDLVGRPEGGAIIGADALTPGALHEKNPGLLHYGIHGVETLYALMGPGCDRVSCHAGPYGQAAAGVWNDGRVGTVRAMSKGPAGYGFIAYRESETVAKTIGTGLIYRELLKRMIAMFESRKSPLDPAETIEIIGFIEAARISAERGGTPVNLPS